MKGLAFLTLSLATAVTGCGSEGPQPQAFIGHYNETQHCPTGDTHNTFDGYDTVTMGAASNSIKLVIG